MKASGCINTTVLILFLGSVAPQYVRAAPHEQSGRPPLWVKRKPAKNHQEQQQREGDHRAVWQKHRAQDWQSEHRNWHERGGYKGYRIPDRQYRGHFGPEHAFRIHHYPIGMAGGYIRFQYGGFGFSVIDPWPEYWSDTWYDNDDVYIDYSGDGYYLYNRRHPRDRIAITVNIN